jgi:threonylcarbamoyladenosine tRNA methylthiotransferase MtaB
MNRHYDISEYVARVNEIREAIQGVAITTDIIVGFPGETDEEFKESLELCRQLNFSRIHVFPYSRRNGTRAVQMPGQCSSLTKKLRSKEMLDIGEVSLKQFHLHSLGQTQDVLFEFFTEGHWTGYTDTYIKVYAKDDRDLTNRLLPVKLFALKNDGVLGQILK